MKQALIDWFRRVWPWCRIAALERQVIELGKTLDGNLDDINERLGVVREAAQRSCRRLKRRLRTLTSTAEELQQFAGWMRVEWAKEGTSPDSVRLLWQNYYRMAQNLQGMTRTYEKAVKEAGEPTRWILERQDRFRDEAAKFAKRLAAVEKELLLLKEEASRYLG